MAHTNLTEVTKPSAQFCETLNGGLERRKNGMVGIQAERRASQHLRTARSSSTLQHLRCLPCPRAIERPALSPSSHSSSPPTQDLPRVVLVEVGAVVYMLAGYLARRRRRHRRGADMWTDDPSTSPTLHKNLHSKAPRSKRSSPHLPLAPPRFQRASHLESRRTVLATLFSSAKPSQNHNPRPLSCAQALHTHSQTTTTRVLAVL